METCRHWVWGPAPCYQAGMPSCPGLACTRPAAVAEWGGVFERRYPLLNGLFGAMEISIIIVAADS